MEMTVKMNNVAKEMALRAVELAERQRTMEIINLLQSLNFKDVVKILEDEFLSKVNI